MASDLTRRIGGAAAALLCCLSLAACNSAPTTTEEAETAPETTETTAEPTDAAAILDAVTESGPSHPVSSFTIETSSMKSTTTFTYDDAGNLVDQKTEGTTADTTSTETISWTYDGNTPKTRDDTTDGQGTANSITTTYAAPEYQASGDGGTLTLESTGKQADTNAEFTFTEAYDLADGGKTLTGYQTATKAVIPSTEGTDTQSTEGTESADTQSDSTQSGSSQGGDVTSSQSFIFDDSSQLSELSLDIMGQSGTFTFSYEGNTVKVSGSGVDQTWTIETDENGCITKAVNEEAGCTVTVTYGEVANPTDFNRAVAKTDSGKVLGTCVYGVMGSDLLSGLEQMETDTTTPAQGTTAEAPAESAS